MSERENKGVVPVLRFPEFRGAGEWEEEKLGEILKIGNGRGQKHLSDGNIPVYGSGGYMRSVNDYLYDGESACIGRKGTIDNPIFLTGKFWTVDTLFYTYSFKECLPIFVFSIFQNIDWLKHNEASGVPSLSKTNIEKIEVAVPKLPEQQKIADCLSSIDELIVAHTQKHEALKTQKYGLMQQIFSQELRFKDNLENEFPDRSHNNLGNIAEITTGRLDANAMVNGGKYRFYTCAKEFYQIDEFAFDTDALLVSGNGANVGYVHHYKGKFNAYQRTYVIDEFSEYIFYVKYYLDYFLKRRIGVERRDGNTPYIVKSTLGDMEIDFPCLEEQQKIADCLSSLDELITTHTAKIKSLKAHKKGLMQQLFPVQAEQVGESLPAATQA